MMRGGVVPAGSCLSWGLRNSRNLCNTPLNVRGRLQEYFNDRYSIERLRLDVFDIVNGGSKIPLSNGNDAVGHVLHVRQQKSTPPSNRARGDLTSCFQRDESTEVSDGR